MANSDLKNSALAAALYFLVANPWTYSLMQSLLGGLVTVTDINGTPTQMGTLLHAIVFGLLTYLVMRAMAPKRDVDVLVVNPGNASRGNGFSRFDQ